MEYQDRQAIYLLPSVVLLDRRGDMDRHSADAPTHRVQQALVPATQNWFAVIVRAKCQTDSVNQHHRRWYLVR